MGNVEMLLRTIKDTWKQRGLSIASDRWTNAQKMSLINFMATSKRRPIFLTTINGTKEYKDKHYISQLFLECIAKVGLQNVVQIITNNAAVIKSAGSIVEAKYPHIF